MRDPDGRFRVAAYRVHPAPCSASPSAPSALPAPPSAPRAQTRLYAKYVSVEGIPVVSSAQVSDHALLSASTIVRRMLRKRPDIRDRLVAEGVRVAVMSPVEQTARSPRAEDAAQGADRQRRAPTGIERARGLGGSFGIPVASAERSENLQCMPCDRYRGGDVLMHEFGHTIEDIGLARDLPFQRDLVAAYDDALAKGLWRGTYSARDRHEYWAVGVQIAGSTQNEPWDGGARERSSRHAILWLYASCWSASSWQTAGAIRAATSKPRRR